MSINSAAAKPPELPLNRIAIESALCGAAGCLVGSMYSFSPQEGLDFFPELATGAILGIASRVGAHYLLQKNGDLWKKRAAAFGIPLALRAFCLVKGTWFNPLIHFTNQYGTALSFIASVGAIGYGLYQADKEGKLNARAAAPEISEPEEASKEKDPFEDPKGRTPDLADKSLSPEDVAVTQKLLGIEEEKKYG